MTRLHFADLTAITAPFGLLDDDTQQRLRDWPHGVEVLTVRGVWVFCDDPRFFVNFTYRARPAPLVQDTVDWSQVGPEVNHFARDITVTGFQYMPHFARDEWVSVQRHSGRIVINADRLFPSCRRGTTAPRDSLISRPGVKG